MKHDSNQSEVRRAADLAKNKSSQEVSLPQVAHSGPNELSSAQAQRLSGLDIWALYFNHGEGFSIEQLEQILEDRTKMTDSEVGVILHLIHLKKNHVGKPHPPITIGPVVAIDLGGLADTRHSATSPESGFPQMWGLFQYLLPWSIRKSAYNESYDELLADYLVARQKYKSIMARRWLTLFFSIRTVCLFIHCLGIWSGGKFANVVCTLIKMALKIFGGGH